MKPTPKNKYLFTFAKDSGGNDVRYRFILTLDRRLEDNFAKKLFSSIVTIDGVDAINPHAGIYSIEIAIARTFDANEVINAIEEILKDALSGIIKPQIISP